MNSVKFDPAARDEFLDAVVYYEQCRKGLGKSFRKQVELALSKISEMPFFISYHSSSFQALSAH